MTNTINDFWSVVSRVFASHESSLSRRMIWEENVSVLVMITNIKESGRVKSRGRFEMKRTAYLQIKCDMYWPDQGAETYGNLEVTLISMTPLAYYVKRVFTMRCKSNGKVRRPSVPSLASHRRSL